MQSQKNILVLQHDSALYGASQSLLTILEHLGKNRNLEILVLLPKKGLMEERLKSIAVNYKVIPFPRCITNQSISLKMKLRRAVKYFRDEDKMLRVLTDLCNEFKPDLIYTNTSAVSIGFKLSRSLRVPHVWHIREFGDIDFQYLPYKAAVKRRILKSERVIFVSRALMSHWVKSENNKFRVVYNGIDSVKQNTKSIKKPAGSKWRFGLVGPLIPSKGQSVAINAFLTLIRFYPDCTLHLFGGMEDKLFIHELKQLITVNKGNEKVFFHDFIADQNRIYQALDVVLSCSVVESFGRTVVEAMSHGIPVIANASGGPIEIIEDEKSGLLYNGSAEDLFKKMQLLMTDDDLYNLISERAIAMAQERFNVEQYVGSVEGIIMEVIAGTMVKSKNFIG